MSQSLNIHRGIKDLGQAEPDDKERPRYDASCSSLQARTLNCEAPIGLCMSPLFALFNSY